MTGKRSESEKSRDRTMSKAGFQGDTRVGPRDRLLAGLTTSGNLASISTGSKALQVPSPREPAADAWAGFRGL